MFDDGMKIHEVMAVSDTGPLVSFSGMCKHFPMLTGGEDV